MSTLSLASDVMVSHCDLTKSPDSPPKNRRSGRVSDPTNTSHTYVLHTMPFYC